MMKRKKMNVILKYILRGLPLAGAVASTFFPLHQLGRQFMILIVLVWVQVFFIFELFLAGR
jgi:hypothetical protein